MSLNITYHFHDIEIAEPAFSEFYFKLFKKINYLEYRDLIITDIKNQLKDLIMSGKDTGVMIDPEIDICKPLKDNGYPSSDVVYILRELGTEGEKYLDSFSNDGSLKITPKGKKWIMDILDANQVVMVKGMNNTTEILTSDAIHKDIKDKCLILYQSGSYAEAVEKSFKIVRDKLRELTGYERGFEAFGAGKLHVKGAAAPNVDNDFNQAIKFLTMAIDMFRNEKSHTSDAKIDDPVRAFQYLVLSSLALSLLDNSEIKES
jgi:uncharacterized protein (TIGR02391 family)